MRICLEEFRYESAVDCRADEFDSAFDAACPGGVDVYFDNTAGRISDAVIRRLNVGARVVVCGTASIASWPPRRTDRASSVIFSSSARACRVF